MQPDTKPISPPTPELDKMRGIVEESHMLGAFLDWLNDHEHMFLAQRHTHTPECGGACGLSSGEVMAVYMGIEPLLAKYFGIDLKKVEEEKLALLDWNNRYMDWSAEQRRTTAEHRRIQEATRWWRKTLTRVQQGWRRIWPRHA